MIQRAVEKFRARARGLWFLDPTSGRCTDIFIAMIGGVALIVPGNALAWINHAKLTTGETLWGVAMVVYGTTELAVWLAGTKTAKVAVCALGVGHWLYLSISMYAAAYADAAVSWGGTAALGLAVGSFSAAMQVANQRA